jgi:hypothetical protein
VEAAILPAQDEVALDEGKETGSAAPTRDLLHGSQRKVLGHQQVGWAATYIRIAFVAAGDLFGVLGANAAVISVLTPWRGQ